MLKLKNQDQASGLKLISKYFLGFKKHRATLYQFLIGETTRAVFVYDNN